MTRYLPPEILDLVVDNLHDQPTTLGTCCVVSKSWIPRTRRHLFAHVEFNMFGPSIALWMAVFPDPLNSPARYARTLTVIGLLSVADADNDVVPWVRAFHNVVYLDVTAIGWCSLELFYGLSPAVRSLRLQVPKTRPSAIFGLICSFPLLEDIALLSLSSDSENDGWTTPPTFPRSIKSLLLSAGIGPVTRRLLDLPNGPRFTKIAFELLHESDFDVVMVLVSRHSDTLEYLDITEDTLEPVTTLFDLSKATKLKYLAFQCYQPGVQWITMALQTIGSKDLQQITLRPNHYAFRHSIQETVHRERGDLDRLLVQFRTSRSRPKIVYEMEMDEEDLGRYTSSLLPELAMRGLVDMVQYSRP